MGLQSDDGGPSNPGPNPGPNPQPNGPQGGPPRIRMPQGPRPGTTNLPVRPPQIPVAGSSINMPSPNQNQMGGNNTNPPSTVSYFPMILKDLVNGKTWVLLNDVENFLLGLLIFNYLE